MIDLEKSLTSVKVTSDLNSALVKDIQKNAQAKFLPLLENIYDKLEEFRQILVEFSKVAGEHYPSRWYCFYYCADINVQVSRDEIIMKQCSYQYAKGNFATWIQFCSRNEYLILNQLPALQHFIENFDKKYEIVIKELQLEIDNTLSTLNKHNESLQSIANFCVDKLKQYKITISIEEI